MQQTKIKAFTLVELIIVITILAILATIGFLSFQGYVKSSRDSNRVTALSALKNGLDIYAVKVGRYPDPDDIIGNGTISGKEVSKVGIIGDTLTRTLSVASIPKDPLYGVSYTYGVSSNGKIYQLGTLAENSYAASWLVDSTYAASLLKAKVVGNYNGYLKYNIGNETWLANLPSLLFSNTGVVDLMSSGTYFVVDKEENFPLQVTQMADVGNITANELIKKITQNENATLTGVNITGILNKTQSVEDVFTGSILSSFVPEFDTTSSSSTLTALSFIKDIVTGVPTTSPSSASGTSSSVTYKNCTFSGETILHGNALTLYSESNISGIATYGCNERKGLLECNDGVLSSLGSEYTYLSCVKGTINNCGVNASYTYNGHTYAIPALNHGSGATQIDSTPLVENHGTYTYHLASIECNDGTLINANESPTPNLVSCENGYSNVSGSCIQYSCATQPNYTHATFTSGTPISVSQAWTNSTDTSTACRYECTDGYTGNDCSTPPLVCNALEVKDAGVCKDPDYAGVVALLHMDNGVTDEKGHTYTPNATQTNTSVVKFGSSLYFSGSAYLVGSTQLTTDIGALAGNQYTFETWVNPTSFVSSNGYGTDIVSQFAGTAANGRWRWYLVGSAGGTYNLAFGYTTSTAAEVTLKTVATASANTWTHIAMTIDASNPAAATVKLFINGVPETFTAQNMTSQSVIFDAHRVGGGANYLNNLVGYLDDLRITKGALRYIGTYTLPVKEFTNQLLFTCNYGETNNNGTCKDDNYTKVIAGLHMDGNATDIKGHTYTATATQANASVYKFGSSLYFPGSSSLAGSTQLTTDIGALAGNQYTFETWVHPTSFTSTNSYATDIMSQYAAATANGRWKMYLVGSAGGTYNLAFGYTTSTSAENILKTVATAPLNAWTHIAVTIDATTPASSTIKLFINGVPETFTAQNLSSQTVVYDAHRVGGATNYLNDFVGYMDDMRITKGALRYTTSFALPKKAFANQ